MADKFFTAESLGTRPAKLPPLIKQKWALKPTRFELVIFFSPRQAFTTAVSSQCLGGGESGVGKSTILPAFFLPRHHSR